MDFIDETNVIIQKLEGDFFSSSINVFIKRDDLLHPEISGNKWWKLKYNLEAAQNQGFETILTFGGAYSNHIAATAAACKYAGLKSIGIIRGEKESALNPTLKKASADGMELFFVSREDYRNSHQPEFLNFLKDKFNDFYLIPEGGKNILGVKGCTEITKNLPNSYDYICCACGTGTTLSGIVLSNVSSMVLGFSALKGGAFLVDDSLLMIESYQVEYNSNDHVSTFNVLTDYHFGGYAKVKQPLLDFAADFFRSFNIELDLVYTAKMFYGIKDLAEKGFFPKGSSILAIHSGGLQGNMGFK
jgi:1-aminocyclopropane-1-carboxylate deaminase